MIPELIHFAWTGLPGRDDPPMPEWAADNIARFRDLNPDHEVIVHGQEAVLPKYRTLYEAATSYAHTSDLLRYSVLQSHGGWWFDVDVFPFRPVADIESAYGLDGRQLFVTEQHGHKNKRLIHNGAMLGAGKDCIAWPAVDAALMRLPCPPGRTGTGPGLLTQLVRQKPNLFLVGAWPWFYPAKIGQAGRLYEMFRRMGIAKARRIAPTGGQLPFCMHLWANEKAELVRRAPRDQLAHYDPGAGPFRGQCACLAATSFQWNESTVIAAPMHAIAEGLAGLGFAVDVHEVTQLKELALYDLLLLWNARKGHPKRVADLTRTWHLPTLILELGFFTRNRYWQVDHRGILHWASWAEGSFQRSAPPESAERMAQVWPHPLASFDGRQGNVLVLGQLARDSQMDESEIQLSTPLEKSIARSLPHGIEAVFRPHPRARVKRVAYLPRSPAGSLREAVQQAKFAVTINSNAGNECLAMGCPVLCFGPALYAAAGVAKRTTMASLRADLADMLDGWRPSTEAVHNYLHWLACRQWSPDEFREGAVLRKLVEGAFA